MPYKVIFKPAAEKALGRLAWRDRDRLLEHLKVFIIDPRPPEAIKLKGYDELWRVRSGNFRAICIGPDGDGIIRVLKIGHRRVVYQLHRTPLASA